MTIIEAYERSYARRNQGVRQKLAAKKSALQKKKQRLSVAGEEEMRLAYAKHMQLSALKGQQNRAKGRHGGADENSVAGLTQSHRRQQEQRLLSVEQSKAAVDSEIQQAEATAQRSIASNERELQLKKDQQQIKEEAAAAKAATKSSKKSGSKSKSSVAKTASQSIIEQMQKGKYSEEFAAQLGWTDAQVRAYVYQARKNIAEAKREKEGRLPGTYKPALR